MKKQIVISGIGMGSPCFMTDQVKRDIEKARVLIGAPRMLDAARMLLADKKQLMEESVAGKCFVEEYRPEKIVHLIRESGEKSFCILMSGDTGFYSGTKKLSDLLGQEAMEEVTVHPGISSLSALCAAFGKDYNEVSLGSVHGKTENIAYRVRTHRLTFLLTDGDGKSLAGHLCEYGLGDVRLYAGYQISYADERFFSCRAKEYEMLPDLPSEGEAYQKCLLSLLIENESPVNATDAFEDGDFIRGRVPMTKSEVRYQICGMLNVKENGIVYDIGAGTGAVTLELGRKVPKGIVYAVECDPKGVELIGKNSRKHAMDQIKVIEGMAPDILEGLPAPDAVFIGGSRGRLQDILSFLRQKKKEKKVPVVISAVTLETLGELLENRDFLHETQIMQIQTSQMKPLGNYHRMEPANPVWLIKGYL